VGVSNFFIMFVWIVLQSAGVLKLVSHVWFAVVSRFVKQHLLGKISFFPSLFRQKPCRKSTLERK